MDAMTQMVVLESKNIELTTKYGIYRGKASHVLIEVRKKEILLGAIYLTPEGAEWASADGRKLLDWTERLRNHRSPARRELKGRTD